jgi:hypothetical protein
MYGPHGEAVEVHTQEHFDRYDGLGWQKSPLAFGIETHPSHPVQTVTVVATAADGGGAPMLPVAQVQAQVSSLEGDVAVLQGMVESLTNRVGALEDLVTQAPATGPARTSTASAESVPAMSRDSRHSEPTKPDDESSTGRRRTS